MRKINWKHVEFFITTHIIYCTFLGLMIAVPWLMAYGVSYLYSLIILP